MGFGILMGAATRSGWVYVSWAQENETRWILSVWDSYAPDSPAGLLAEQLKPPSQPTSTHQAAGPSEYPIQEAPPTESIKTPSAGHQQESEALGLFIVKKLCGLLRASMDVENTPGKGTLVRIRFLSDQASVNAANQRCLGLLIENEPEDSLLK